MAEYVSKETLLKAIEKMDRLDKETNTQYEYDKEGYILLIKQAPTADVEEVKHGEWQRQKQGFYFVCSVCGKASATKGNYCHSCGAKMEKENAQ